MRSQPSRSNPSLPGCEAREGEALQRAADAPLKPKADQQPPGGLFGDSHKQLDIFDQLMRDCFKR